MSSYAIDTNWYMDFGATDHITNELEKLSIREMYNGQDQIHVANGNGMSICHIGNSILHTPTRDLSSRFIHYKNLVSVHKFSIDNDVLLEF